MEQTTGLKVGSVKEKPDVGIKVNPGDAIVHSKELMGTVEQRAKEEKTIYIKFKPGLRPEVIFTGFWSGRFITAATNAIAKSYRLRRHMMTRKVREVVQKEEAK